MSELIERDEQQVCQPVGQTEGACKPPKPPTGSLVATAPGGPPPSLGPSPESQSIRTIMEDAWRDHHHTREQTWKTVQFSLVLLGAMVAFDYKSPAPQLNKLLVVIAGVSTCVMSFLGAMIAMHHREVEHEKRKTILKCEEALLVTHLIVRGDDRQNPRGRTTRFILLFHVMVLIIALVYIYAVLYS